MSQAASSSAPNPHLSRLARLGAGLGLKSSSHSDSSRRQRQHSDANETDWYIPYNGPYELPKDMTLSDRREGRGRAGDRDSWDMLMVVADHDPFSRDYDVQAGRGGSSHGHGQVYGQRTVDAKATVASNEERGRTRSRAFSGSSKYSESVMSLHNPNPTNSGDRRTHPYASPVLGPISPRLRGGFGFSGGQRNPVPSFLNLDSSGMGIGESPMPSQRTSTNGGHGTSFSHAFSRGHDNAQRQDNTNVTAAQRASHASFWTFGHPGGRRSSPPAPLVYSGGAERPSAETYLSRPSTSTYQTNPTSGYLGEVVTRDRSATVGEDRQIQEKASMSRIVARPRANTALPPSSSNVLGKAMAPTLVQTRPSDALAMVSSNSSGGPIGPTQHIPHPYAIVFPSPGHREHSRVFQSPPKTDAREKRPSVLNLSVPFLTPSKTIVSNLRASPNKLIKSSVSTPNLRAAGTTNQRDQLVGSGQTSPSSSTKWLSAETWCDALIFPRPRFRVRAAHVISPPGSPTNGEQNVNNMSSPFPNPVRQRTLKKSSSRVKVAQEAQKWLAPPTSAPLLLSAQTTTPSQPPVDTTKLRPPRPKSFAQDDLALPSPVPSLARVLKEGEEFEKERNVWKKQAINSFQNTRSRSLSRSRMKSIVHSRKTSIEEAELATSFSLIAASAFHGNQSVKPSVSIHVASTGSKSAGTNSTGLNTMSSHSRKSSGASHVGTSRGHGRKESWGTSALKTAKNTANATGLCAFNADVSPIDEKASNGQDIGREGKREQGENGVLLIAPHANLQPKLPSSHPAVPSSSPIPSDRSEETSHSGVGIALSTPTVLVEKPFVFPDHPYATGVQHSEDIPHPSDYAGPHPTSVKVSDLPLDGLSLNDVSVRHRLPVAVNRLYAHSPHPYAANEQKAHPTLKVTSPNTQSVTASSRMFAQIGGDVREVLPDEIQYSPYSPNPPNPPRNQTSHESDALGVEEALSVAFSHGSMENDQDADDGEEDLTGRSEAQIVTGTTVTVSAPQYRKINMSPIEEVSTHNSWMASRTEDSDDIYPLVSQHRLIPTSSTFKSKESSPDPMSLESSPMTSPRQFRKFDDTEDYSDLFYRPGQHSAGNSVRDTPSSDVLKSMSSREPSGSIDRFQPKSLSRSTSGSALMNLSRQLSEQYNTRRDDEQRTFGGEDSPNKRASEATEISEDVVDTHAALSYGPSSGAVLPLRTPESRLLSDDPSLMIPEDVESSRASSIIEHLEADDGTEVFYRVGEVPALATPNPTGGHTQRASAHGSYFGDHSRGDDNVHRDEFDEGTTLYAMRPSLIPPPSASDATRASYVTSTSSTSRISNLSDFPVPPTQNVMTPGAIIQSYLRNTPQEELEDPVLDHGPRSVQEERREKLRIRRTTFGGEEEIPSFE